MKKVKMICAILVLAVVSSVFLSACGSKFAGSKFFEGQYEKYTLRSADEIKTFAEKYSSLNEKLSKIDSFKGNYKVFIGKGTKTEEGVKAIMNVKYGSNDELEVANVEVEKVENCGQKAYDKAFTSDAENYDKVSYSICGSDIYVKDYYRKITNSGSMYKTFIQVYSGTYGHFSDEDKKDMYGFEYDIPILKPRAMPFPNLSLSDSELEEDWGNFISVIETRNTTKIMFSLSLSYSNILGIPVDYESNEKGNLSAVIVLENDEITGIQYRRVTEKKEMVLQIFPTTDTIEKPVAADYYSFEDRIVQENDN